MKKFVSILLSCIFVLSSCVFTYAEESDYSQILLKVKELYNVGEYDDFTYNTVDNNLGSGYDFKWENDDGGLEIRVNKDLYTLEYNLYSNTDEEKGEAVIDKVQAQKIADEFLEKALKDKYSYFKLNTDETKVYAKKIDFVYDPYVNGYKVEGLYRYYNDVMASVEVDLTTGNVTDYSCDFPYYDLDDISDKESISISSAKDIFLGKDNMEPVYREVYDEESKGYIAKPLYTFKDYYINAYTGKLLSDDNVESEDAAAETDEGAGGGSASYKNATLTEKEKEEIEKLRKSLSKDEAVSIINNKFGLNIDVSDVGISYTKRDGEYIASISQSEVFSATINSDKIIEYCVYYGEDGFTLSGYNEIKNFVNKVYPAADVPSDLLQKKDISYSDLSFYDKVNGIKDSSRHISLSYNDDSKVVDGFYYYYSTCEHINFDRELTNEEIFNIANDNAKFELVYIANKGKLKLCYGFPKQFTIDISNGDFLDRWGMEFEPESFSSYKDVDGTWYGDMANSLISYGYSFDEDVFDGNKKVTSKDIAEFMNYATEDYEENPEAEITKYEMAKILVDRIGYTDIAEKADFELPFKDVSDEYKGYVAICKAFDIAKGDNNLFNGDNIITRAEMAAMVYNYVVAFRDY